MERYFHHPVLGTNLVVGIDVPSGSPHGEAGLVADELDGVIVDEIARLEAIFTIFNDDSELQRWKRTTPDDPSPEFVPSPEFIEVLTAARYWVTTSGGAFHPLAAEFSAIWRRAAADGTAPQPELLAAVAHRLTEPGFEIVAGRPVPTGDVSSFQLHAFAKGWIVDRALARAFEFAAGRVGDNGELDIIVNAGGDLVHRGPNVHTVGIENPLRPYDNEPPIDRIRLNNAGLATSGRARQGFEIGGRQYSHVIDPRTGWSVDHHESITVVAPTAATADVVATIAGVEPAENALRVADRYGVACVVVDNAGQVLSNQAWMALRV